MRLLAPLEVVSRAAHALLFHCSLEHSHVLTLPMAHGGGGGGGGDGGGDGGGGPTALCGEGGVSPTAMCSWGVTQDDQHRYVVRLAVAETEEAAEREGEQGRRGAAPRAWSEFVPVERDVTLSLAHPDGEHVLLLRVAVSHR